MNYPEVATGRYELPRSGAKGHAMLVTTRHNSYSPCSNRLRDLGGTRSEAVATSKDAAETTPSLGL